MKPHKTCALCAWVSWASKSRRFLGFCVQPIYTDRQIDLAKMSSHLPFFPFPFHLLTLFRLSFFCSPPSLSPFPGVLQTYRHSYFGAGTSHMLIGNLYCYRSAPQLASCYGVTYNYIPSYACSPHSSHVAGVKCIGEYTVVCKSVQEYARVCKSMQEYARVCKSLQECARVCKSVQAYARVCKSMQECARVCKCARVYKLSTFQSCSRSEVYW